MVQSLERLMLSGQLLRSKTSHQPTITKGDHRHRHSPHILPGNAVCKVQETAGVILTIYSTPQSPMMLTPDNQSHQPTTWKPASFHLSPILVISVLKDGGQEKTAELRSIQLSTEHTKNVGLGARKMAQYIKCLPSMYEHGPQEPQKTQAGV